MRIGINIPKELHQRLQPLKGTINISQICREALEAHVTKYEASAEWLGSDEAKVIAVCHCEADLQRKAMVEIDWETVGYQDARDWAQAATLGRLGLLEPLSEPSPSPESECYLGLTVGMYVLVRREESSFSRRSKDIPRAAP